MLDARVGLKTTRLRLTPFQIMKEARIEIRVRAGRTVEQQHALDNFVKETPPIIKKLILKQSALDDDAKIWLLAAERRIPFDASNNAPSPALNCPQLGAIAVALFPTERISNSRNKQWLRDKILTLIK